MTTQSPDQSLSQSQRNRSRLVELLVKANKPEEEEEKRRLDKIVPPDKPLTQSQEAVLLDQIATKYFEHGQNAQSRCKMAILEYVSFLKSQNSPPAPSKEMEELRLKAAQLEWIWSNCRIVYFPSKEGAYPLEHTTMTQFKKDMRIHIEREMIL